MLNLVVCKVTARLSKVNEAKKMYCERRKSYAGPESGTDDMVKAKIICLMQKRKKKFEILFTFLATSKYSKPRNFYQCKKKIHPRQKFLGQKTGNIPGRGSMLTLDNNKYNIHGVIMECVPHPVLNSVYLTFRNKHTACLLHVPSYLTTGTYY
jgi:hypothetical protein